LLVETVVTLSQSSASFSTRERTSIRVNSCSGAAGRGHGNRDRMDEFSH
jgi:hypothetical protein